jgi:hypothetical protein
VLCDIHWIDPDMESANGISAKERSDMLRLDAMILIVQLNIRTLREAPSHTHPLMTVASLLSPSPDIPRSWHARVRLRAWKAFEGAARPKGCHRLGPFSLDRSANP